MLEFPNDPPYQNSHFACTWILFIMLFQTTSITRHSKRDSTPVHPIYHHLYAYNVTSHTPLRKTQPHRKVLPTKDYCSPSDPSTERKFHKKPNTIFHDRWFNNRYFIEWSKGWMHPLTSYALDCRGNWLQASVHWYINMVIQFPSHSPNTCHVSFYYKGFRLQNWIAPKHQTQYPSSSQMTLFEKHWWRNVDDVTQQPPVQWLSIRNLSRLNRRWKHHWATKIELSNLSCKTSVFSSHYPGKTMKDSAWWRKSVT